MQHLRRLHHQRPLVLLPRFFATYDGRLSNLNDGSESTKGQDGRYCGEWDDEKTRPHGHGTMVWDNGVSYEGEWCDGKFHGAGSKLYSRGGGYIGTWAHGHRQGTGAHLFNGKFGYERFDGVFEQDQPHGGGVMTYSDGRQGEFTFEHGKPMTKPVEEQYDGPLADFDDGSPSTVGADGTYAGSWDTKNQRPHGYGIMRWANGIEYKGIWENGKYHGHGRKLYSRGGGYEGLWEHGKRSGTGISFFDDGREDNSSRNFPFNGLLRWEGPFENDKAHGVGQSYYAAKGMDGDNRWEGDTAVKGQRMIFRNGDFIDFVKEKELP